MLLCLKAEVVVLGCMQLPLFSSYIVSLKQKFDGKPLNLCHNCYKVSKTSKQSKQSSYLKRD